MPFLARFFDQIIYRTLGFLAPLQSYFEIT